MRNFLTAGLSLADPNKRNSAKLAKAICILAAVFLFGQMLFQVPANASVTEIISNGYTTASGDKFDLVKGVSKSPADLTSGSPTDLTMRFFFSEGFFAEDFYKYNPHLASTSMCMAMASIYASSGEYSTRSRNIVQYMKDIGVEAKNIHLNRYNKIKPEPDSIGVTFGWKEMKDGRILIPIAVRSANYEQEWMSNVTLGSGNDNDGGDDTKGEAKGFSDSATKVYRELITYVNSQDKGAIISEDNKLTLSADKKFVFWIAGYSRGAAVSNLTAKRLVELCHGTNSKVVAYTFGTPRGGWKDTLKYDQEEYDCIHNVIDLADIVTKVAPQSMKFIRYGVDHYVPGSEYTKITTINDRYDNYAHYWGMGTGYNEALEKMKIHLKAIDPNLDSSFFDRVMSVEASGISFLNVIKAGIVKGANYALYGLNKINIFISKAERKRREEALNKKLEQSVTKAVKIKGSSVSIYRFLDDFINNLCSWTELTRDKYVAKGYGGGYGISIGVNGIKYTDSTLEDSFRDVMYALNSGGTKYFNNFSSKLLRKFSFNNLNEFDILEAIVSVISKGTTGDTGTLNNALVRLIQESGALWELKHLKASEINKLSNHDLLVLVNLATAFLLKDYDAYLYDTRGMSQTLTLADYITKIGQNHIHDVIMAWLRADDSLYENETTHVTDVSVSGASDMDYLDIAEVKISAEGDQVLFDVGETDDLVSDYVQDVKPLLSQVTSIDVLYESGTIEKLPVTWNTLDYESYYYNSDHLIDKSEDVWISYDEAAGEKPEHESSPRLYVFNGRVNLPDRVSNPYNVSIDVKLEVFVDGLPKVEEPYAYPPAGVYYGSQKVYLFCEDPDAEIYYQLTLKGVGEDPVKYTGPITLELEEGATEEQGFILEFYSKSKNPDKADSNFDIGYYTIRPVDPDDQVASDGTFNYTLAKTFMFSKDIAVCWRVNSADIKLTGNTAKASEVLPAAEDSDPLGPGDVILFDFDAESADTVPAKEAILTVISIATITPAGDYSIPVQISTDGGKTWTDDSTVTFRTSELVGEYQDNGGRTTNSSGGGCNAGFSVFGAGLACMAFMFRRKSE